MWKGQMRRFLKTPATVQCVNEGIWAERIVLDVSRPAGSWMHILPWSLGIVPLLFWVFQEGLPLDSFAQEMCTSHIVYTSTFSRADQRQSCESTFLCLWQSVQSVWLVARDSGCSSAAKLDAWWTDRGSGLTACPNRFSVRNKRRCPQSGAQIQPYCALSGIGLVDILRWAGLKS